MVKNTNGDRKMTQEIKKRLITAGALAFIILAAIAVQGFAASTGQGAAGIKLSASYRVINQKAIVKVKEECSNGLKSLVYQKGNITSLKDDAWKSGKKITDHQFSVTKKGKYSILATDKKGEKSVCQVSVVMEIKAVWIYFDEMKKKATSYSKWKSFIDSTFTTCKNKNMNTVILQVRPFADAMYPSKYYPWSSFATGTAGKNPGFDPLAYAVKAAHAKGLMIQAWINPYRITNATMKKSSIAKDSIALKWLKSSSTKRNVLKLGGAYYFNPAKPAVRTLVANGVKELVQNYDLDGIHMDDYFYPSLGSKGYKKFDYKEYKAYVKKCKANGTAKKSLVEWRRSNVNVLVRKLYETVKSVDKNCVFGISPAGNLTNLYSKTSYYSDVKRWMGTTGYIDYICPQIYWSFKQRIAPYKKVLNQWTAIKRDDSVNLYIGLAGYRAGISKKAAKALGDPEWGTSRTVLKRQVVTARNTKKVDGFAVFSYSSLKSSTAKKEIANLKKVLAAR